MDRHHLIETLPFHKVLLRKEVLHSHWFQEA